MSETIGKRCREPEALPDYNDVQEVKRCKVQETYQFLDLLQLDQTLADEEEEEASPVNEELLNRVMRSLEEETATTCSTSYTSSNTCENSAASDISSSHEAQILDINLCYLLEASDDELGIPPSPALIWKDEVCQSPKQIFEGLSESSDLKSFAENWHFEDDFENYQQFALYEGFADTFQLDDYMSRESRDFVGQDMLFDGDSLTTRELETARGM